MEITEESKNYSEKEEEEEDMIIREDRFSHQDPVSTNFEANIDLMDMDLSLGNKEMDGATVVIRGGGCSTSAAGASGSGGGGGGHGTNYAYIPSTGLESVEKEHMFDKAVTPSDVGKLNRLVIPKQHAEKFFPLDSDKGLLLSFEDRNGKSWRFRYSYWNSSQSYVMTKGWSRFVKEKKLDAGDIVSFQRGVGDLHKHRLFIDWMRRPDHHAKDHAVSGLMSPLLISNHPQLSPYSVRWGGRLYSLPHRLPPMSRHRHENMEQMSYNFLPVYPPHLHHQPQQQQQQYHQSHGSGRRLNEVNSGCQSLYCFSSPASPLHNRPVRPEVAETPVVIDSVPIGHHTVSTSKRLRLFGVNMECSPSSDEEPRCQILPSTVVPSHWNVTVSNHSIPLHLLPSPPPPPPPPPSSHLPFQLRSTQGGPPSISSSYSPARFQDRGGSSVPFDVDASIKYFG